MDEKLRILLCEDDEHILEAWENVKDIFQEHPQQVLWFSTDLSVYNYDRRGERFFYFEDEERRTVDMAAVFGREEREDTSGVSDLDQEAQLDAALDPNSDFDQDKEEYFE